MSSIPLLMKHIRIDPEIDRTVDPQYNVLETVLFGDHNHL